MFVPVSVSVPLACFGEAEHAPGVAAVLDDPREGAAAVVDADGRAARGAVAALECACAGERIDDDRALRTIEGGPAGNLESTQIARVKPLGVGAAHQRARLDVDESARAQAHVDVAPVSPQVDSARPIF